MHARRDPQAHEPKAAGGEERKDRGAEETERDKAYSSFNAGREAHSGGSVPDRPGLP